MIEFVGPEKCAECGASPPRNVHYCGICGTSVCLVCGEAHMAHAHREEATRWTEQPELELAVERLRAYAADATRHGMSIVERADLRTVLAALEAAGSRVRRLREALTAVQSVVDSTQFPVGSCSGEYLWRCEQAEKTLKAALAEGAEP